MISSKRKQQLRIIILLKQKLLLLEMKIWKILSMERSSWLLSHLFLLVLSTHMFVMEALLDTSILSWNVRGAQNNNSRRHLKDLIGKYRPTFLAILETHVPFSRLSKFWLNNGYNSKHIVEANGHSREI